MKYNVYILFVSVTLLFASCKTKTALTATSTNINIKKYTQEITEYQETLNADYSNPETSPLGADKIDGFVKKGGHDFFEIDPAFRVVATLDTTQVKRDVGFQTSSGRIAMFDRIGIAKFKIEGKEYGLSIYESHALRNNPEYQDYLFVPFKDLTSGKSTYGGGRYLDMKRQKGNTLVIDFNKAYNPYCAYSANYSCPVTPKENYLDLEVMAGIKLENE